MRKRASTGERERMMILSDTKINVQRTVHYLIYVGDVTEQRLAKVVSVFTRHPQELEDEYENICVTSGKCNNKGEATAVLVIDVTVAAAKKWTSTGSDIYLHYLLQLGKMKIKVVETSVQSSSHVVDRIAAHSDYTLVKTRDSK